MLTDICDHIHNYFVLNPETDILSGTFQINNGTIDVPGVLDGQRFRIRGSRLNDGIYTYHSQTIKNDDDEEEMTLLTETFTGTIELMSIPAAIRGLLQEIKDWMSKYGTVVANPFSSENVTGVYNYSKTVKSENAGGGSYSWQDVFRSRLNAWRKIA